jgi:MOSC domain-containing protein YiiM
MDIPQIASVQTGRIARLGPQGVPSGFVKTAVEGPVSVGFLGLSGDEQADLSVHGGPEKAVYGYGLERYALWQAEHPQYAARLVPGSMGENLTIAGMDEDSVCLGDVVRAGSAVLQVAQPRQPCFKFALRFDDARMPRAMVRNGRSGWYYRVLEEGSLAAGDEVTLLRRTAPDWTIARFYRLINARSAIAADLAELAELDGLASQWRSMAREAVGRVS